jgi:hypothetical protein
MSAKWKVNTSDWLSLTQGLPDWHTELYTGVTGLGMLKWLGYQFSWSSKLPICYSTCVVTDSDELLGTWIWRLEICNFDSLGLLLAPKFKIHGRLCAMLSTAQGCSESESAAEGASASKAASGEVISARCQCNIRKMSTVLVDAGDSQLHQNYTIQWWTPNFFPSLSHCTTSSFWPDLEGLLLLHSESVVFESLKLICGGLPLTSFWKLPNCTAFFPADSALADSCCCSGRQRISQLQFNSLQYWTQFMTIHDSCWQQQYMTIVSSIILCCMYSYYVLLQSPHIAMQWPT